MEDAPAGDRGVKIQAAEAADIFHVTAYPQRITISAEAEAYLLTLTEDLAAGRCELWQLPPSLLSFYTFAHGDGVASCQPTLRRLEDDAARLYFAAFGTPYKEPTKYKTFAELQADRDRMYALGVAA